MIEETIKGSFKKRLFLNEQQGYGAFVISDQFGAETTIVGPYCYDVRYAPLNIRGYWEMHDRGREFHATNVAFDLESSRIEVMASFFQELVKGLPIEKAKKFASEISELENSSDAAARKLWRIFSKMKDFLNLFLFLYNYGGYLEEAKRVYKKYPDDAIEQLQKDPFRVFNEAKIRFKVADLISLDSGIGRESESRLQAILTCCLRNEENSGNVYIDLNTVFDDAKKYGGDISSSAILAALMVHPYVKEDDTYSQVFYMNDLLKDEKQAAREFVRLMYSRKNLKLHPELITEIEKEIGHPFGDQQKQAFNLMNSTGIKLLTGDPGTGKTTTLNGLLRYLEKVYEKDYGKAPKIALCAPSGRAAQRMKESTGRNALTVHKLLNYQPFGDSYRCKDASDPIDADVIVVDETSMLGLSIFGKLEGAIRSGSLLLLVGDTNQLQSVDPGSVLHDIIKSGYVDSCHLTEIFRQAKESCINIDAKMIINGDSRLRQGPDFQLIHTSPEDTPRMVNNMVNILIREAGDRNKVQVLAPVKKGSCGVRQGNTLLQPIFNPSKEKGVWYGSRNYKPGDRVIMLSNNYEMGYYNGDVGYIKEISNGCAIVQIGPVTIDLTSDQFGDMALAYECTVHKSQGSEYEYLIVVLQQEAKGMMNRNLLYTAVTRAKKKIVVIYEGATLQKAIEEKTMTERNSHLVERIKDGFAKLTEN